VNWWSNRSKKGKIGILAIALVLGCGVLGALQSGDDTRTAVAPAVKTEAAGGPTALPPTPAPTTPPWDAIKEFRQAATDAQWEAFVKNELIGSRMAGWEGYVYEVKASGKQWRVDIDLEDPTEAFLPMAEIKLTTESDDAINWYKGTPVLFSGTVKKASYGMGVINSVELENATVEIR
jgi:hypothetical protein